MSARDEVTARRVAEAPELSRKIMRVAYEGRASPRSAIKAMCLICTGYDRAAIRNCTGWSCPLWAFRPYREPVGGPVGARIAPGSPQAGVPVPKPIPGDAGPE